MVADFSRLTALSRLASMATAVDGPSLVRELAVRMEAECDYVLEAEQQRFFRDAFRNEPDVLIPETIPERTRRNVLTSAFAHGADFYAFAGSAPAARRNSAGTLLARFAFRSLFGLGRLNADPHPGNYLFPDSGVVFLDFGCVTVFEPEFIERERALARVVLDGRREAFRDAVMDTGMVPDASRLDFDVHWQMLCHQYAPYRVARFRFTFDFIRTGMQFNRPENPNLRHLAIPPPWIWEQRLVWGLHAVLARLECEGNFAEVLREALAERAR
jgi:predicted unusual protein kinase regulating ubiquinone biosynthesis (AarF/ABC1/UbiB family)